jgi:glycosyltransferase involved in cell wall biosynthesis
MVSIEPAMTQERLKSIYDQSTIFILPSLITEDGDRDGIPNVLVEAMAIGLPVISTNISGIPELIRDGESGLLVPQREPAALALAIERLLGDPELGVRMAIKGGEFIHQRFDARKNIATLKGLFDEVLKVGGR